MHINRTMDVGGHTYEIALTDKTIAPKGWGHGKEYPADSCTVRGKITPADPKYSFSEFIITASVIMCKGVPSSSDKTTPKQSKKCLELTPNDAAIRNNLGLVYAEMGKVDEAKAEFQKAADINPAGASGYYCNLGLVMFNQGKMDEAAVALKEATDLDPANASAFYWYGMALLGKAEAKPDGRVVPVPGTVEAFQTYLKLQPNGQWAQAAQASLDQLKRP